MSAQGATHHRPSQLDEPREHFSDAPDCPDCRLAGQRKHHGFMRTCPRCNARAIGRGIEFWHSQHSGKQLPAYRALLQSMGLTHADVLAAHDADWMQRHAAPASAAPAALSTDG